MYQENKESASVDPYPHFSVNSNSYVGQQPLFRDISDMPRVIGGDFNMASSPLTPDVYRSLSGGSTSLYVEPQPLSFMPSSFPSKDLDMQPRFDSYSTASHWEDFHVPSSDKTKAMEDIRGPLIESFPASSQSDSHAPPAVPEYLDPSNFSSSIAAADLYQNLISFLKSQSIDVDSKPAKYRLRCSSYPNSSPLTFVIRVYRAADKKSVVECQRRKGCVIEFGRIFKLLKCQADSKKSDTATSITASPLDGERMNEDHAQETTQCLLLMAKSQFVDVKSKAVEALASLSSQDRALQDLLIKEGSVSLLLDGCSIKTQDVHRPALTALANLADGRVDVCRAIADDKTACTTLAVQLACPKGNCPQVVRECARVFSTMGHSYKRFKGTSPAPSSSSSPSLSSCAVPFDIDCAFVSTAVQNLSCSKDPLTLQRAHDIQECFDVEGVC